MNKSSFSSEFDHEKENFWSMTKINGPKGAGVTMHTTLNRDPMSISGEPTGTFRSSFKLENGGTFEAPPALPKDAAWCSTIHSSKPPVPMDNEWEWAFNPPKK